METIEQLLKQAETQHKILELNALFSRNLTFFKEALPNVYEQFKHYTPTEIKIIIQDNGTLDLANINLDNKLVYGSDPKEFAVNTVKGYVEYPLAQRLNPDETEVLNMDSESHTPNINKIIRDLNAINVDQSRAPLDARTEFMFMLGVGFGYQITELLKYTDIQHLVIAETNLDIFFASLHTLDWKALNDKFSGEYKTLNLILGQTPDMFTQMVAHHAQQIGIFNLAKPYVFTHLSSDELTTATASFLQNVPIIAGALGYFDDEKVGLTHSINNFKNKIPFMKNHGFLQKRFVNKPVFLIANGPSLDIAKDFIAENREKAILVSCGTALSSLFKLGIKPDFHVELERTYPTKEWIDVTTTQEFRDGIILLAVNTVHPDLPKIFNTTGMALKYNDLGGTFIEKYISDKELSVTLGSCNPLVSNAGLSFCAALGFTNIYLFGMDLGFPEGKHHSTHSFHSDIKEEDIDSFQLALPEDDVDFKLPANFGGNVISNRLYFRSKLSLEAILKDCKEINCYNTCNGVLIEKATPTKVADIDTEAWSTINKKDLIPKLYKEYFGNKHFLKIPVDKDIVKIFQPAIDALQRAHDIFEKDISSYAEGISLLRKNEENTQDFALNKQTNDLTRLIKGSSDSFSLMLALCLNANNKKNGVSIFNSAKESYRKYLRSAQDAIKNNLLENDYSAFNIEQKLKK